jgi:hypothetical protein
MRKIGNLFELAEKKLMQEKKDGLIICYMFDDIIEYAIKIRKWLDNNPKKTRKILKSTLSEIRRKNNDNAKNYYLDKKMGLI